MYRHLAIPSTTDHLVVEFLCCNALVREKYHMDPNKLQENVFVHSFARTASMQNRAFSVVGPRIWNDLPQELRLFPRSAPIHF